MKQKTKIILYLLLIVTGWAVGQYPYVPSFKIWFISHVQPNITVVDKCVSVTLLCFSLALFFVFWKHFWGMLIMLFFTWGFFNNAVDEFTNRASIFTSNEKLSLLFALLTTSILIWKRHRKLATK